MRYTEQTLMAHCVSMEEVTGLGVPATMGPVPSQRLPRLLSPRLHLYPTRDFRGASKAQYRNAVIHKTQYAKPTIKYPFYTLLAFRYSGFTTLIHTCSTNVTYFSCQYVIALTTLSFLKEETILAFFNSFHDP